MSVTELRKAKKEEAGDLAKILVDSGYTFDDVKIDNIKPERIYGFVDNNIACFDLFLINNKIEGFSFSYGLDKAPDKLGFFGEYFSFFQKIGLKFSNKYEAVNENFDSFVVDFIYFDKNITGNYQTFIKYLEVEKIRNKYSKMLTKQEYLKDTGKGKTTYDLKGLALYNLIEKI